MLQEISVKGRLNRPSAAVCCLINALLLLLMMILSGCSTVHKAPIAELTPTSEQRLQQWLDEQLDLANIAIEQNRLMRPKGRSAYDIYRAILDIVPNNAQALAGVKRLSGRYLSLAKEANTRGDYDLADTYLARSMKLQPNSVDSAALLQYFKTSRVVAKNEYRLDASQLSLRNEEAIAQLALIANQAKRWHSRITIFCRNDAEGRWMYQQLKSQALGYRFRANIEIGPQPKVILLDQQ